jgi:hypothetical protein
MNNRESSESCELTSDELNQITAGFNVGQFPPPLGNDHGDGIFNGHANNQGRGAEVIFTHGQTK